MSVAECYQTFCNALVISTTLRQSIGERVGRIVRCLNHDFRNTDSSEANSFYVGSYGRQTAIPTISDVDVVFELPKSTYDQYNAYSGNRQSALLQSLRTSVRKTYPTSDIAADGQVVVVTFADGIRVEVLGAFLNTEDGYTFPDSNNGGSWKSCKPKQEMEAFRQRDTLCNGNLIRLSRMLRAWKDRNNVAISGTLIDTLAYQFIDTWPYRDKSYLYYEWLTRDALAYLSDRDLSQEWWQAPGSGSYVRKDGNFQHKARIDHGIAASAAENFASGQIGAAKEKSRSIYGTGFPA